MPGQAWAAAGASVSFAVQNERFLPTLKSLTASWRIQPPIIVCCDVNSDVQLSEAYAALTPAVGSLDAVAHCIAHAPRAALTPAISTVTREDFTTTMSTSAYSLLEVARRSAPLLKPGSSITTLTFDGSRKVRAIGNCLL